jgi:hypothetical protein
MQNPYRRVSYKVQLLLTISILTCGIIQSSPKISLIELDCITIYNGINQTPQDENLSWEAELKQDAKKARERKAVEREKKRIAAEAVEREKKRIAAEAVEREKKRIAAEEEKKLREAEREKKRIAEDDEKKRIAEDDEKKRIAEDDEKKRIAAEKEKQRKAAAAEKEKEKAAIKAAPATEFKNWSMAEARSILVLYIFLTAISLLSLYLYNRNRKLKKSIEYLYNRNRDLQMDEEYLYNRNLQKDIEKQEKDIIKLIEDLKKTIQELTENKIINATINQQLIEERDIIPTKEIKEISKVVEKFFMSYPSSDGSFNIDKKHSAFDSSCYYEFEKTGDNLYEFFLIDEAAPKALRYPDKVIDPVCDSIEGSSRISENIITVTKGKAELDGSVFRVIEKSQIKYIKEKRKNTSRIENSTIENLQADIRELEQKLQNFQTLVLHTQQKHKEGKLSNEHHAMSNQSEKMFYMSIPNQDGTFSHTAMRENYDPTSCFYSFVDNEDGTFLFRLEEGSLNLALKYPHKIIDPVCDIVDGSLQYSTNVDIVRYGKAVQSKDTFKVIEKLKIRLI